MVVDEATPRCGIASDVAALCVDRGFDFLNAPVKRVTAPHAPVPFSATLEDAYMPSAAQVIAAVRELGERAMAVPIAHAEARHDAWRRAPSSRGRVPSAAASRRARSSS